MPTVFVSHGAPTLLIDQDPTCAFFEELGRRLPRPQAILCASAHWERPSARVTSGPRPETVHDFYGFPPELYEIRYPCPGDPALAESARSLLAEAGIECGADAGRGLDHGAWVPLSVMVPGADIPVVQVSILAGAGPREHLAMGRALEPLRERGVLVIGSGGATHNLREFGAYPLDAPPLPYAREFDAWLDDVIENAKEDEVLEYTKRAPQASRNHPTPDHFHPLFVPLGAAGAGAKGKRLHRGFTYGVLSMAAYAWGA